MKCESAHEAISADLDGELSSGEAERLTAHVSTCEACSRWRMQAQLVTRRVRVGGALPEPEQPARVVAAVHEEQHRRRTRRWWLIVAAGVVGAGLVQLLATVPLLLVARSHTSGGTPVPALGLVELGIGAGFFLGALVVLWRERDRATLTLVPSPRFGHAAAGHDLDVHEVA